MGGYAGTILYVDLTSGKIDKHPLDMTFARAHIGGMGFGARIYFDLIRDNADFDALSPENPFVLMTGPLTGMKMDGAARWAVGTKSPLTGFWGDSNVGGFFGARLKFAGYDGIVMTGKAERPVYLFIENDTVEIRDAGAYWGLDTYETNDCMVADLKPEGKRGGQVLCIGPAGENHIRYAALLNNKRHAAGRAGMGAVWGAKNLKAVYVNGNQSLEVAEPEKLKALKHELKSVYEESIFIDALRASGTPAHIDVGVLAGDVPMKNWQMSEWDAIDDIGPTAIEEKIHAGHKTCFGCGVACKKDAEVKEGKYRMPKGPAPEYETVATFGSMCLNADIESIAKANEICNRAGMDTITCGSTIAFAIDCFENGVINEADTDGLQLTWGNSEAIVALTEKIAGNQGFGAVLAEGSARAAQRIGNNAEAFLTTVKGMEAPMHDPRSAHGYALAYGVSPRGACHEASLDFNVESGAMLVPEIEALAEDYEEMSSDRRAQLNVACQDYGMFFSNCAIFCNLGATPLNATQAVAAVNLVTGFDYTLDEVLAIGKQLWYLKRGLTNLFGARAKDDRLPERLLTVLEDGPTAGSVPETEKMLTEFYDLRGLDADGIPKKEILVDIGLSDLAELLYYGPH
ncbi:MAG: aldehyde ferredoxin oxidoreductase family protein [Thermodesulfobacteriota bacterium]